MPHDLIRSSECLATLRCPRCGARALRRIASANAIACDGCGRAVRWSQGFGDFVDGDRAASDSAVALDSEVSVARRYDGLAGASYDWLVRHELSAEFLFRRFWGASHARVVRALAARLADASGARVLDVPVGGGAALARHREWLAAARWVVGVDLSARMLERASRRLAGIGLRDVVLLRAPATRLPLGDGTVDRVLAVNSLHCFADWMGALREIRRVLAPGGSLAGSCVVRGGGVASDRRIERMREQGHFAVALAAREVERGLVAAGLGAVGCERVGAVLVFEARS